MKRIYYSLMLIIIIFAKTAFAGSIEGKVTNGTIGFNVPKSITVELSFRFKVPKNITVISNYLQNKQDTKFKLKTTIDKNGYFSFKNIPLDTSIYYQPTVSYKGVRYTGKASVITSEKQTVKSNVKIYEPTKNDSLLFVSIHHFFIIPAKGFLSIEEILLIENPGDRTYIGSIPTKSDPNKMLKKFITINYKLPKNATDINLGSGLMLCCAASEAGGFYDTMVIQPGKKQIVFSYRIKTPQKQISFTKQVTLPTQEFDVLLYGSNAVLTGTGLQKMQTQRFQNTDIKRFTAYNLKADKKINLYLSGLSGAPTNWSYFTISIALALLLITGLFFFKKQKKMKEFETGNNIKDNAVINNILNLSREELLDQIVELDEEYEQGKVEEQSYLVKRNELKNKLSKIDNN